jgi:type I restriction enzyme R subunit
MNEADTKRKLITPAIQRAGWDESPHRINEEHYFTDGRIVVSGQNVYRKKPKFADYILRYTPDLPIAVVEAKSDELPAGNGMQQAKDYGEILDVPFVYATNGRKIVEFDFLTGTERKITAFPTPEELFRRLRGERTLTTKKWDQFLEPGYPLPDRDLRYYQDVAVNRAIQAVLAGDRRILLTMATGTGKTLVAFEICWRLWSARWNLDGSRRKPKILYLADRTILVDDPKDTTFWPFEDARWKIEGKVHKGREMYFALYQAIAEDERRPGLYKEYAPDFFDLIIIDECHRGSARAESSWRGILKYFDSAAQIGMTATPKRDANVVTYEYFGNPVYTYSLRQGIEDGFLAPYQVRRIITDVDATGWRPEAGQVDEFGVAIPDEEYHTKDFERTVVLRSRTRAIAGHITEQLKKTGRFQKTIVFCVDQEHADEMRRELANLNSDLVKKHPNYAVRITSDEGEIGRMHLSDFQDPEKREPVIVTTSQLLTTGVDVPTCRVIVLATVVDSMVQFKQMIGRGTRVRPDHGKLFFTILDYTGSATRHFADPAFDGIPELISEEEIDAAGKTTHTTTLQEERSPDEDDDIVGSVEESEDDDRKTVGRSRKYYVDGVTVEIAVDQVYELSNDGKRITCVKLTDYTAKQVRTLYGSSEELRVAWGDPVRREEVISSLAERGIDFAQLQDVTEQAEADPFDLLCHLAFNAPLRTRRERAERVRAEKRDFFDSYGPAAREILDALLTQYSVHGVSEFRLPDALQLPPIQEHGNATEIAELFGGPDPLRDAVERLQSFLYAA